MAGIRTPDLPLKSTVDEFLANKDSGAGAETVRVSAASVAAQMRTLIQLNSVVVAVKDKDLSAPPVSPTTGDRYIVAASPTGAWVGHAKHLAEWDGAAWGFTVPVAGYTVLVLDEFELYAWNATTSQWETITSDNLAFSTRAEMLAVTGVPAHWEARVYGDVIAKTVSRARAANVATIVTDVAHGLGVGVEVNIRALGGSGYNGHVTTTTGTTGTTIKYASAGADETTTADTGGQVDHNGVYKATGSSPWWAWAGDPAADANIGALIDASIATEAAARDAAISIAIATEVTARNSAISAAVSSEAIDRDAAIANAIGAFEDSLFVASLPSGLGGVWTANTIGRYPGLVLPNLAVSGAPEGNIIRHPRRCFTTSVIGIGWYLNGFTTITENGTIAGYDGTNDATRLTATTAASGYLQYQISFLLPAGTYTLACWHRSRTGSNQTVRMSRDGLTTSVTRTITPTWSRNTYTFTLASPTIVQLVPIAHDGTNTLDVEIMDAKLYAGATAPADVDLAGHLYLGIDDYASLTCTAGELDLTAGHQAFADWKTPFTSTASTIIVIGKKIAADRATVGFESRLWWDERNDISGASWSLNDIEASGTGIRSSHSGQSVLPVSGFAPDIFSAHPGYHMLVGAQDGAVNNLWLDDVKIATTHSQTPPTTKASSKFAIAHSNLNIPINYKIYGILFWPNRKLTEAEIRQVYTAIQSRITRAGQTLATPASRVLVAEGDSITVGPTGGSYAKYFLANASPAVVANNLAQPGSMITNAATPRLGLTYRAADLDGTLPAPAARVGRKFILTVFIGANDLQPVFNNAANFLAALWAYTDARRAAGWIVGVATILPKGSAVSGYATHNTLRATVNPAIVAAVGAHCDFVIDFAANATMGPDAAANDTGLYSDGLHPTASAHQTYLEPIYRAAVNAV